MAASKLSKTGVQSVSLLAFMEVVGCAMSQKLVG